MDRVAVKDLSAMKRDVEEHFMSIQATVVRIDLTQYCRVLCRVCPLLLFVRGGLAHITNKERDCLQKL
jgi:hypothetical protein